MWPTFQKVRVSYIQSSLHIKWIFKWVWPKQFLWNDILRHLFLLSSNNYQNQTLIYFRKRRHNQHTADSFNSLGMWINVEGNGSMHQDRKSQRSHELHCKLTWNCGSVFAQLQYTFCIFFLMYIQKPCSVVFYFTWKTSSIIKEIHQRLKKHSCSISYDDRGLLVCWFFGFLLFFLAYSHILELLHLNYSGEFWKHFLYWYTSFITSTFIKTIPILKSTDSILDVMTIDWIYSVWSGRELWIFDQSDLLWRAEPTGW